MRALAPPARCGHSVRALQTPDFLRDRLPRDVEVLLAHSLAVWPLCVGCVNGRRRAGLVRALSSRSMSLLARNSHRPTCLSEAFISRRTRACGRSR